MANKIHKYKSLYAKQLRNGLRKDGKSIAECCSDWGIARSLWYKWIENIPEFAEAVEISEIHMEAHFTRSYRDVMEGRTSGNAGMYVNAAKYILGWDGKPEKEKEDLPDVKTITIQVIDNRAPQLTVVENNVIDLPIIVKEEAKLVDE